MTKTFPRIKIADKQTTMDKDKVYKPDRKWIVELTEQQLLDIIDDVEDIHRFLAGQTELHNTTQYVEPISKRLFLRGNLRDQHSFVTPELSPGQSYDYCGTHCPNEAQREKIKRSYAVYRNLKHCVTKFRNANDWSVYNHETLTCGVPLAICYPKTNEN